MLVLILSFLILHIIKNTSWKGKLPHSFKGFVTRKVFYILLFESVEGSKYFWLAVMVIKQTKKKGMK